MAAKPSDAVSRGSTTGGRRRRVGHHVDEVRDAGGEGAVERRADLVGIGDRLARPAERAHHLVVAASGLEVARHVPAVDRLHRVLLQPPHAVVADDHHDREAVAHQRVGVHQAEAGGPVAEQGDDLGVGPRHPGRDGVAQPVAEAAVRAGVEPAPGLEHLDVLAGVRGEVAAVADHDGVARQPPAQLAVHPARLDRVVAGGEQRGLGRPGGVLGGAQLGDPRLVVGAGASRASASAREDGGEVAGDGAARRRARPAGTRRRRRGRPAPRRSARSRAGSRAACRRPRPGRPRCRSSPRVRRNASSWSAGRVPRPSPLVNTGTRRCSTAAAELDPRAGPVHVAADDERRPLGGGDRRRQASDRVRVGLDAAPSAPRRRAPRRTAGPKTSSGKSTNTGPRCGSTASAAARVHHARRPSPGR